MTSEEIKSVRYKIKTKALKNVKRANKYAEKHGTAAWLARGIIHIDPEKHKDSIRQDNGITYVSTET